LETLLETISSKVGNPQLWKVYAKFYTDLGEKKKAIDFLEKQRRASQKPSWEIDQELFNEYGQATLALAEAYLEDGTAESLSSGKMMLRNMLKRAEDSFSSTELYQKLEIALQAMSSQEPTPDFEKQD
jgi:hypothetical protein